MSEKREQMIPTDRAVGNGYKSYKIWVRVAQPADQVGREINVELVHTPDTPAISENELFTDKLHYILNETSGHGDPIGNTSAGALWKIPPMDRTGDNGCGLFNARDRDSLIVEQLDRVTSEIHVRGLYKMRQGEELFTYEAYRIRKISDLSNADGELATEQKFVAENDAAIGLFFVFVPMLRQNLGTSASEMNNDVLLMLSLVSGIATDVVAPAECPDAEFNLESYLNDLVTVQDALAFHVCPFRLFKGMLSNTTITRDHKKTVFPVVIRPVTCRVFPRTQNTLPCKWQLATTPPNSRTTTSSSLPMRKMRRIPRRATTCLKRPTCQST